MPEGEGGAEGFGGRGAGLGGHPADEGLHLGGFKRLPQQGAVAAEDVGQAVDVVAPQAAAPSQCFGKVEGGGALHEGVYHGGGEWLPFAYEAGVIVGVTGGNAGNFIIRAIQVFPNGQGAAIGVGREEKGIDVNVFQAIRLQA